MEHCRDGAACSDPTCFLMHPCTGRHCGHYGNVWLTSEHFKYNAKKRFKTCIHYSQIMKTHPSGPYAVAARKRKLREEHELETIPEHDLSAEGKAAAFASALRPLQAELARMRLRYPGRVLSCKQCLWREHRLGGLLDRAGGQHEHSH